MKMSSFQLVSRAFRVARVWLRYSPSFEPGIRSVISSQSLVEEQDLVGQSVARTH